jgi:5-formyltetrahydrofolate cyclo-ligase
MVFFTLLSMENGPFVSEKALLRQSIRSQLRLMSADERRKRSLQICTKLARLLAGTKYIALFAPRPTEPDLDLLWGLRLLEDRLVAYPRCDGENLLFFAVTGLHELHPGRFGIREPEPERIVQQLDAIVIPGLAFTQIGSRVGQGAGFYDRFLESRRSGTIKIGVCFDFQIVPKITSEEHDVNVDLVVSA